MSAALPGTSYDGHTPAKVVLAITEQIDVSLTRVIADAGHRARQPRTAGLPHDRLSSQATGRSRNQRSGTVT
jgi:hypothetical protein